MNFLNYYYYFQNVVPHRICDDIIRYAKSIQDQMAITGGYAKEVESKKGLSRQQVKDLKKARNSDIVWLDEKWIYKEIHPFVQEANIKAGWNFHWDWSEHCQFTKYNKGQFYDWHSDAFDTPYDKGKDHPWTGKIRKLSVSVSLSDPKDYKGGELEFDFRNLDPDKKPNIKKCTEILPKGSLVVFPGFVWHRVCPVKKGSRYSLVIWNLGWPYR